jgi:hypothetical protein
MVEVATSDDRLAVVATEGRQSQSILEAIVTLGTSTKHSAHDDPEQNMNPSLDWPYNESQQIWLQKRAAW